jgi:NTE family protein
LPLTFGRTTLLFGGEFGFTPEDRPIERSYSLGGFLNVSGYQPNSLLASDFWTARMAAYHRFSELKIPLFGFGFFVGSSVEFTSLRSDIEQIPDDPSIVSGSVFVGADTPLIPAYLSFGLNDESSHAVTFNLGRIGTFRR